MKYLFMVVHRCARSAEESITIPAALVTRRCVCTRHRRLKFYSRSGESFSTGCETRPVADISITPIAKA